MRLLSTFEERGRKSDHHIHISLSLFILKQQTCFGLKSELILLHHAAFEIFFLIAEVLDKKRALIGGF